MLTCKWYSMYMFGIKCILMMHVNTDLSQHSPFSYQFIKIRNGIVLIMFLEEGDGVGYFRKDIYLPG